MPPEHPVKLTLRLDRRTAEAARRHARARGITLSELVADYLRELTTREEPTSPPDDDWKAGLSPITRALLDRAPAADVDEADYYRYLEEKHR